MISEKYKVVLLDIEGTTSAIDFVHTTMFDYARNNLEGFLDSRNLGYSAYERR